MLSMEKMHTITGRRESAIGTTELTLSPKTPDDRLLFTPGQYVEIWLDKPAYRDDGGIKREFSINTTPEDEELRVTFRNSPSAAKLGFLEAPVGSTVHVSGPHGYFTLPDDVTQPVVLVAGGVGVTPFISMVRANTQSPTPRQITLIAANARPERAPFREEFEGIAADHAWLTYKPIFGKFTPEVFQQLLIESEKSEEILNLDAVLGAGKVGDGDVLQATVESTAEPRNDEMRQMRSSWYIAGPPGMVSAAFEMLTALGIPRQKIQLEEFSGYK